jgi:hypothetical protein
MGGRIAGHQTGSRHPADFYPTHPDWTRALLAHVDLTLDVWEPACGDGAMVRVLEEAGHEVRATDIADGKDFLESELRAGSIVTNPPYRLLDGFVRHGLRQADKYLCLLVGWHFLAGGSRRVKGLWRVSPPNLVVALAERMRVNGSTSQFNHAWCVWDVANPAAGSALRWHLVKEDNQ